MQLPVLDPTGKIPVTMVPNVIDPSDVGFDVILCAGQSNEAGYGNGYDPRFDIVDPRVWQYAGPGTYVNQVIQAQDPLYSQLQAPSGYIGHALTFARRYLRQTPAHRQVLIVPAANGGTAILSSNIYGSWNPEYVPGAGVNLTLNAIAKANQAIALDPKNRIVAILWLQGEQDALGAVTGTAYQAKLDEIFNLFRSSITGAANVPIIVGQMLPESIAQDPNRPALNAVHIDTPRRLTRTAFVYGPTGYPDTSVPIPWNHYLAPGQRVLGLRYFDGYNRALVNVLNTPPPILVAPTVVQSGTSVIASWPQPSGRVTDFNVQTQANGGSTIDLARAQSIDVTATATGFSTGDRVQVRVRSVNEQGTSDWSAWSSVTTLVPVPGQVANVRANGNPTGALMPVQWDALTGATSYLVNYKKHTDSGWTTWATVTGTTSTIGALFAGTSYDVQVIGQNAGGQGTPSVIFTQSTGALGILADDVGVTPAWGYSVARKVVSTATRAIQVRRSSDNATQDIGFVGNNLDTTSLLSFCGSDNGYIAKLYDQASTKDFVQATTTKQPQIVTAGVLNTVGSIPAARFDGVAMSMFDLTASDVGLFAASGATISQVHKASLASFYAPLFSEYGAVSTSAYYAPTAVLGNTSVAIPNMIIRADDTTNPLSVSKPGIDLNGSVLHSEWIVDTGTSLRRDHDSNSLDIPTTYSRSGKTFTLSRRVLGSFDVSGFYNGNFTESIGWAVVLTEPQIAAGKANQKTYYSTP